MNGLTQMLHVTSPDQINPTIRDGALHILEFATGADPFAKGDLYLPAHMCGDDDMTLNMSGEDSNNDKIWQLWHLFRRATNNRMLVLFNEEWKSPKLGDQLDEIISLFPIYTKEDMEKKGKWFNENTIIWMEVDDEVGTMHHSARHGPGESLQAHESRVERRESIIPMGSKFTVPVDFVNDDEGNREYLRKFDDTIKTLRLAIVKQILTCGIAMGRENLFQRIMARLPLPKTLLHSFIQETSEAKLTLSKDNGLGGEGLETAMTTAMLTQCQKEPSVLIVDASIARMYDLRYDSRNLEGAADEARRKQSLIPISDVYGGKMRTIRERRRIICAPQIPDLQAGPAFEACQSRLVYGDYWLWQEDADFAKLENNTYKTADRAVNVMNGDTGAQETLQLELGLRHCGIFLRGKLTWFGAGVLREIRAYTPYVDSHIQTGSLNSRAYSDSNTEPWFMRDDAIQGDDNGLWERIRAAFNAKNMQLLDTVIEYNQIPPSLNLYNLVRSAGYLERYRSDFGRMSTSVLSGLDEANRLASAGREEVKPTNRTATLNLPLEVGAANMMPAPNGNIVIHIPTIDSARRHLFWPIVSDGLVVDVKASYRNDSGFLNAIKTFIRKANGALPQPGDSVLGILRTLANTRFRHIYTNAVGSHADRLKLAFTNQGVQEAANWLFFGSGNWTGPETSTPAYLYSIYQLVYTEYTQIVHAILDGTARAATTQAMDTWLSGHLGFEYKGIDLAYYTRGAPIGDLNNLSAFIGSEKIPVEYGGPLGAHLNILCWRLAKLRWTLPLADFISVQRTILHLLLLDHADNAEQITVILNRLRGGPNINHPMNILTQPIPMSQVFVKTLIDIGKLLPADEGQAAGGAVIDLKAGERSAEDIDNILRRIPISEEVCIWLLRKNVVFPMAFIGVRTDNRFDTASALAVVERTAMFVVVIKLDVTTSLRQEHHDLQFQALVRYAVVPENRRQIALLPDVKSLHYGGGAGLNFMIPTHQTRALYNNKSNPAYNSQVIVLAVPPQWKPASSVMDLAGFHHQELQIRDYNSPPDYPTALLYTAFWGGFGVNANWHLYCLGNLENSGRTTTILATSFEKVVNGQWVLVQGCSPIGYKIRTESYRIADGRGIYGGEMQGTRRS